MAFCDRASDLVWAFTEPFIPTLVNRGAGLAWRILRGTGITHVVDRVVGASMQVATSVHCILPSAVTTRAARIQSNLATCRERDEDRALQIALQGVSSATLYHSILTGKIYEPGCLGPDMRPRVVERLPGFTQLDPTTQKIVTIVRCILIPNTTGIDFSIDPVTQAIQVQIAGVTSDFYPIVRGADWSLIQCTPAEINVAEGIFRRVIQQGGYAVPTQTGIVIPLPSPMYDPTGDSPLDKLVRREAIPHSPEYENVSITEEAALAFYTTDPGYRLINTFLRGGALAERLLTINGGGTLAGVSQFAKDLLVITALASSALNRMHPHMAPNENILYRCVVLPPAQMNTLATIGHIEQLEGFSSASCLGPEMTFWSQSTGVIVIISPPLELFKGIWRLSTFARENEMLGQVGTRLRTIYARDITDATGTDTKKAIFAKVVPTPRN